MGYWAKRAEGIDPRTNHPLSTLLRKTTEQVKPDLVATLQAAGEYDAYIAVKVNDCFRDIRSMVKAGMSQSEAKQLAVSDMLPAEPEDFEDWEVEGGMEDQADALDDWLSNNAPD